MPCFIAPAGVAIFRKILVSVKFLSAILGPEMAAPILWAPGCVRSAGKTVSIKFLVLGGGYFGFGGGGSADLFFYGREDFSEVFGLI